MNAVSQMGSLNHLTSRMKEKGDIQHTHHQTFILNNACEKYPAGALFDFFYSSKASKGVCQAARIKKSLTEGLCPPLLRCIITHTWAIRA